MGLSVVLFRASGTEPLLRLYTEAFVTELVTEILTAGEAFVQEWWLIETKWQTIPHRFSRIRLKPAATTAIKRWLGIADSWSVLPFDRVAAYRMVGLVARSGIFGYFRLFAGAYSFTFVLLVIGKALGFVSIIMGSARAPVQTSPRDSARGFGMRPRASS